MITQNITLIFSVISLFLNLVVLFKEPIKNYFKEPFQTTKGIQISEGAIITNCVGFSDVPVGLTTSNDAIIINHISQ